MHIKARILFTVHISLQEEKSGRSVHCGIKGGIEPIAGETPCLEATLTLFFGSDLIYSEDGIESVPLTILCILPHKWCV